MTLKYVLLVLLIVSSYSITQSSKVIELEMKVTITGSRAKVFENQLKNYLQNELLKIPDVKLVPENAPYGIIIYIFQLPYDCDWFDFHYRAHFYYNNNLMYSDFDATFPMSEGFESYDDIEEFSKNLISTLNINRLNLLRE